MTARQLADWLEANHDPHDRVYIEEDGTILVCRADEAATNARFIGTLAAYVVSLRKQVRTA